MNFNTNIFQLLFLFPLLTALFFQLLLQLKLIYIIQLLLQLQLTSEGTLELINQCVGLPRRQTDRQTDRASIEKSQWCAVTQTDRQLYSDVCTVH